MDLPITSKSECSIKLVLQIFLINFSSLECVFKQIEKTSYPPSCNIEVNISVDHSDFGTKTILVKEEADKLHIYIAYKFVCFEFVEFCKDRYVQSEYFKTFICKQKSERKKRLQSPVSESLYQGREDVIGSKLLHMPSLKSSSIIRVRLSYTVRPAYWYPT